VASITNHSCTTSAGFALNVDIVFPLKDELVCRVLFHGRRSSFENLLGGECKLGQAKPASAAEPLGATEPTIIARKCALYLHAIEYKRFGTGNVVLGRHRIQTKQERV
jgi:hypothetical protein